MPYELQKVKGGYVVVTKGTRRRHSKKAMPRGRALAQLRALYANVAEARRG